jgi:guanylate kinase
MSSQDLPRIVLQKLNKQGRLFVVSGPSGCGKTTLCAKLLKKHLGLVRSVSVTTRQIRGEERRNKDYVYVSKTEFRRRLKKGMFLEHAKIFGNYYGTPKSFINEKIKSGCDVLLNIDVQGAAQIRQKSHSAVFIFIIPPSMQELKKRLQGRLTDSRVQVQRRLVVASRELRVINRYDYLVVNDNLRTAVASLSHIILASRHRIK